MGYIFAILFFYLLKKTSSQDIIFPESEDEAVLPDSIHSKAIDVRQRFGSDSSDIITVSETPEDIPEIVGLDDILTLDVKAIGSNTPCKDASSFSGFCVPLGSCPTLLDVARFFSSSSTEYKLLQKSYCGKSFNNQLFCCRFPTNQGSSKFTSTRKPVAAATPPRAQSFTTPFRVQSNPSENSKGKKKCDTAGEVNSVFCGKQSRILDRIVGGQEAPKGAWPWATLIFLRDEPGNPFCGGSLITNNHVLTAAHCLVNFDVSSGLSVRLAEHDISVTTDGKHTNIGVSAITRHPNYNRNNQENDIAILHLERGVCFSDRIKPVCVPDVSWSRKVLEGENAFAIGWGVEDTQTQRRSNVLKQVTLDIFNSEVCRTAYRKILNSPGNFQNILCAGDKRGGKDACQGDSGGPLLFYNEDDRFYVAGVVSAGVGCARKEFPGLFSRVSGYYSWIIQVVSV